MLVVDTAQLYTHSWRLFLFFKRHIKRLCLLEGLHSVGYYRHKKIELWEISLADKEKRTKEPRVELTKRELLISLCVWGGGGNKQFEEEEKKKAFFFFQTLKAVCYSWEMFVWGGEREKDNEKKPSQERESFLHCRPLSSRPLRSKSLYW